MSCWTYISGTIDVMVPGKTQAEIDYILQTILDHLPRVTGSEGDMEVYPCRHKGHNTSCSCDEYEMNTNNLTSDYGTKSRRGWLRMQDTYTLAIHAALRDRCFEETLKEFMRWLCRLSKRLLVESVLVRIREWEKSIVIDDNMSTHSPYWDMHESPSWANDNHEPAWWEHLMWKRYKNTPLPLEHIVKYYDDEDADADFEKRFKADS